MLWRDDFCILSPAVLHRMTWWFDFAFLTRHLPTNLVWCTTPLSWKSNNPRAQAPWRNYLPYESMANSKCFCQNRIALTFCRFLQINPEKMTSLQMCRIKKITPCSIQTFWDRQLCFYVKKSFVSEKYRKLNFVIFHRRFMSSNFASDT